MYSINEFGAMIADKTRMDPYVSALRESIKSDSIVMDIGTGTGIFALLACRFGARHVYAIEPNDAIQIGRELAAANGFSEKITFIQDLSDKINLPEKADVIVSDMRGMLPLCSHHLTSIADARRRHLADGGTLIPFKDKLRVALIEAPGLYDCCTSPWNNNGFELDMQAVMKSVMNTSWLYSYDRDNDERTVGEYKTWATINYNTVESPNVAGRVDWECEEAATIHGFRLWFDAEIIKGTGFSNAPDLPDLIYGRLFYPFSKPISLKQGDHVSLTIQANLVDDDYVWRWHTCVYENENPDEIILEYKQSSFDGIPVSITQLQKRAASHQPELNLDGLLNLEVMKMMAEGLSLEEIAHQLVDKFPERYENWQKALGFVGKLSVKYSN